MDWGWSLSDNAGRCNCPLAQNEKQWQAVGNITKMWGNHTSKVGLDMRRAYNLRIPSDQSPLRAVDVQSRCAPGADAGAVAWAWPRSCSGMSQLRRGFARYISASIRSARAAVAACLLRPGHLAREPEAHAQLRVAPRRHQPADRQRGRATARGSICPRVRAWSAASGDIDLAGNVENRLNWAPRLGATYQLNEKTVIRGGYGRSYDLGVFGSLFGHTVTQNLPVLANQVLNRPSQFASVFNLAAGPPAPSSVQARRGRDVPVAGRRHATRRAAQERPPEVDAWNITRPASAQRHDVGRNRLCGQSRAARVRGRTIPDENRNQAALEGFAEGVPSNLRVVRSSPAACARTCSASAAPTAGRRTCWSTSNEAQNWYKALQSQVHAAVLRRLVCAGQLHAAESRATRRRVAGFTIPS